MHTNTPGKRLEQAMRVMGKSLNGLHKALNATGVRGSSYGSVQNYAKGTSEPPLEFLFAAADHLGVRRDWLVDDLGPMLECDQEVERVIPEPASEEADLPEEVLRFLSGSAPDISADFEGHGRTWGADTSPTVRRLFIDVLKRRVALTQSNRDLEKGEILEIAVQLGRMAWEPWAQLSGGIKSDSYEWEAYAVAILHALMLAMPRGYAEYQQRGGR